MEEPASPVRFDQARNTRFFMCRSCRNHVLWRENVRYEDRVFKVFVGMNVVNVWESDVESHPVLLHVPLLEVFCNGCDENIGYKFATVVDPNETFQEGWFMLTQNKILYWNGIQEVYADTEMPVEDN